MQKTDFTTRYFHKDDPNGSFGVGFVDVHNVPAFLSENNDIKYRCLLVLSGTLHFAASSVMSVPGEMHTASAGDVIQFFPSCVPSHKSFGDKSFSPADLPIDSKNSDASFYFIELGRFTYQALDAAGLLCKDTTFHINIASYLINWMPALLAQIKNTPQSELSEVYFNTQKFLVSLHKENVLHSNQKKIVFTESARQLLLDACLSDIDFKKIAAALGVSYESFRKNFKEMTGQSPLQFVLENRFHYAQRFLTEGMSVKEAAEATGYTDPYVFSKQFKKYVGVSPSHYKPVS